jgi:hypothetical protein
LHDCKGVIVPEHNLLFNCRKCGWWAIGTHHSDDSIEREELNSAAFDVKCTSDDCGWSGQLQGSDARQNPLGNPPAGSSGNR